MKNSLQNILEKQKEAREKVEKLYRKQIKKSHNRPNKTQEKKQTQENKDYESEQTDKSKFSQFHFHDCNLQFADEQAGVLTFKQAQPIFQSLSKQLRQLVDTREVVVNLVWPSSPASLPAVHSVATFAEYERANKLGLRTLIYPAKRNAFLDLNHIRVDAKHLYELASKWQTLKLNKEEYAETVVTECEHKDFLYLALNQYLDSGGKPEGYPSIGETLPTFPVAKDGWRDFTPRIFKGIFREISKKGYPVQDLGEPSSAPDALFGLHPDLDTKSLLNRLATRELMEHDGRPPDVAIIDLRYRARIWLGRNWLDKVTKVIQLLQAEVPYSPVGILIVIDDPNAYQYLKNQIAKKLSGGKRSKTKSLNISYGTYFNLDGAITTDRNNDEELAIKRVKFLFKCSRFRGLAGSFRLFIISP